MSKLRTIALFLVSAILIVFAVGNRQPVDLDLWPFYYEVASVPVFVVFFIGILVGVALSGVVMAFRGVKHFTELRSEKKEKQKLSSDVEKLEAELDTKPPKVEQKDYSEEGPALKPNTEKK